MTRPTETTAPAASAAVAGPTAEALPHPYGGQTDGSAPAAPVDWENAADQLARAGTYWLSTVRDDGRPHSVPVLAVMVDSTLHFCAGDRTRKARHLADRPHCVVTTHGETLDLVVEGRAEVVGDRDELARAAAAYGTKYGWSPSVRDGALWADGAPTAGPPPYRLYRVTPDVAFGFPSSGAMVPTRWRFPPSG